MDWHEVSLRAEAEEQYLVDILREMIRIDTSVPPGRNYEKFNDLVEPEFKRFGLKTQRVLVPDDTPKMAAEKLSGPRENLVASLKNDLPKVSVYAHTDVVPADSSWTYDPFGAEVVDGRLYGRGTVDDKGPIACVLGALKIIQEMGLAAKFDIDCLLCTDEEFGGHYTPGADYLARNGYFSNHIIWLDLGAVDPIYTMGTAGSIQIDVRAVGKSCHSGMNFLGVNAIEQMVPILVELMALKEEVEQRQSRLDAFPHPQSPFAHGKMTPMFNLDIIHAGTKANVVPAECVLTLNRRYIPDENPDEVIAEIEEAIERGRKKSKLLDVQLKITRGYGAVELDTGTPAVRKMQEAIKAVKGWEGLLFGGMSGSSDLACVADALQPQKLDVAHFGVSRATDLRAHGADEFVYIEDLVTVTKELVHYFCF
ncbi:MAG: M20 family peptidase [Candidatus Abyssobacteria bacterium SURF_5]|uniref:M20 family peptidase n=1 Tax=Abyssobacteria bacterium (strain SURF_5) TaxID=2093360 RepID=A0A3A4P0B3_ABYX5|nr:MAG: M20 family peptidase [Candidatus Abyssubacteria bacterium SURF_5]